MLTPFTQLNVVVPILNASKEQGASWQPTQCWWITIMQVIAHIMLVQAVYPSFPHFRKSQLHWPPKISHEKDYGSPYQAMYHKHSTLNSSGKLLMDLGKAQSWFASPLVVGLVYSNFAHLLAFSRQTPGFGRVVPLLTPNTDRQILHLAVTAKAVLARPTLANFLS